MENIDISKLREFYDKNKERYFARRESGDSTLWGEQFKWDVLPSLNLELSKFDRIDEVNVKDVFSKLKHANKKLTFAYWDDIRIFGNHLTDGLLIDILNFLWFSGEKSAQKLINGANEILQKFGENPMSPAAIVFLLTAKNCDEFSPFRDYIYSGIVKEFKLSKTKDRGEKYHLANHSANLIGEWVAQEKSGENYQQKALNGQDFMHITFSNNYNFIDEVRSKVEDFLADNPDFVNNISPSDAEMNDLLAEFRSRFSLEKIAQMSEEELLREIPQDKSSEVKDSMFSILEHKTRRFAAIGVFNSGQNGIYYGSVKNDSRMTWRNRNGGEISEREAVDFLRWQFDEMSKISKFFQRNEFDRVSDYIKGLDSEAEILFRRQIIHKYFAVIYPDKFSTFLIIDRINSLCGTSFKGYEWYWASNMLAELGNEFGFSNYIFGEILAEILNSKNEEVEDFYMEEINNEEPRVILKNLILQGPPGTGKTFRIDQIRRDLGVLPENFEMITFHQSYSYEDFIEGIRPRPDSSGQIRYEVEDGIFKQICERARNSSERFLLAIDEINRGNISKIFGELITLIEVDKRGDEKYAATLPYSKNKFTVPENLFIVGTMNTSDRSIALFDIALRRRFEFEEIMPNYEVIRQKASFEGEKIARLAQELNRRIAAMLGRDYQIGHSEFMKINSAAELECAWNNKVLPLIQEYFYGDWSQIKKLLGDKPVRSEKVEFAGEKYENYDFARLSAQDILEIFEKEIENEN